MILATNVWLHPQKTHQKVTPQQHAWCPFFFLTQQKKLNNGMASCFSSAKAIPKVLVSILEMTVLSRFNLSSLCMKIGISTKQQHELSIAQYLRAATLRVPETNIWHLPPKPSQQETSPTQTLCQLGQSTWKSGLFWTLVLSVSILRLKKTLPIHRKQNPKWKKQNASNADVTKTACVSPSILEPSMIEQVISRDLTVTFVDKDER